MSVNFNDGYSYKTPNGCLCAWGAFVEIVGGISLSVFYDKTWGMSDRYFLTKEHLEAMYKFQRHISRTVPKLYEDLNQLEADLQDKVVSGLGAKRRFSEIMRRLRSGKYVEQKVVV